MPPTPTRDTSGTLAPLAELTRIRGRLDRAARFETLAEVRHAGSVHPIDAVSLGARDPAAPCLLLVGGVHGLERIGTEVVLSFLSTLAERLAWDDLLRAALERVRLVAVPLVNPVGMALGTRANGRGVDLMRNAPAHPSARGSPLVGGQRLSPRLPWFRGDPSEMEVESRALVDFVTREVLASRFAIAVDCHSGFGFEDRLWFPHARSREPYPGLAEVVALRRLLDASLSHHVYRFEPQAQAYTIVGDLWDHLDDLHRSARGGGTFMPLTLEMGSWAWVRKNPRQLAHPLGGFNPMVPHRRERTLRRHLPRFELLLAVVASWRHVVPRSHAERRRLEDEGFLTWYARRW